MRDSFENAEREFLKLKGRLAAGLVTPEQFEAALKELIVEDAQGRYWMLGADSGKWYVHNGQAWIEGTPPAAAEPTAQVAAPPKPQTPKPGPGGSNRLRAIIGTAVGGLLTIIVGIAVAWGQGFLRTALLGNSGDRTGASAIVSSLTATPSALTPTRTNTAQPVVIVVTATTLPRTSPATPTRTLLPVASVSTVTPSPMPTFPANAITWSTEYDLDAGKPINVVTNKTFSPPPLKIYASWKANGLSTGTKLHNTWYFGAAVWAQGEYVLETDNASLWYWTGRQDQRPLSPGTYRFEIKLNGQVILTDQVVVR